MISIFALFITAFLEYQNMLLDIRRKFANLSHKYINYFTNKEVINQREIRYIYLIACLPIIIVLLLSKLLLSKLYLFYIILQIIIFILTVEIFTWKEEAKHSIKHPEDYIKTFATRFFAPLFWFIVLPYGIGSTCYLVILLISNQLQKQEIDSMVYNNVVDRMLFYANIIPYIVLSLFIAIAGDFEETTHFLVEQRKTFSKSFYELENALQQAIFIAIGRNKFKQDNGNLNSESLETGNLVAEKFDPQINTYITAILYRIGLFYVGTLTLLSIATFIRY